MPLGYGSSIKSPMLSSLEVANEPIEQRVDAFGAFLRVLLTIGEIAIGFTGIGAVAETGVALAVGTANEVLDIENGNSSATGAFLNFATPLIGGAFTGIRNLRAAGNALGDLQEVAEAGSAIPELLSGSQGGEMGLLNDILGFGGTSPSGMSRFEPVIARSVINDGGLKEIAGTTFQNFNKGLSGFNNRVIASGQPVLGTLNEVQNTLSSFGNFARQTSLNISDDIVRDVTEDERFINFLNKSGMTKAKQLELNNALKGITSAAERRSVILWFVRNLGSRDALRLFRAVSGEIEVVALNEAWQLPFARQIADKFDKIVASKLSSDEIKELNPSLWKRIVRKVGSPQFNDKVVQRAQLIDPNDLGRAGIEHTYQLVKKQIRKYFKRFKKLIDGVEDMEDAFVAAGGTVVDSDWHMGYRVIKDLGINKQLVQITYGKDTGNFKHVMVFATDAELKRYILRPGHTYITEWAFSRGGKALGLESLFSFAGIKSLGTQAATILGFIPVQALKNVLSLVSNYVENIADIANGSYFNTYIAKFSKSLRNSAISRSFRLLGKEVLGGAASAYLGSQVGNIGVKIGDFIGKEAQRVGTQIFATGIKNVINGDNFSKGLAEKAVAGALTSVRSNSLRHLRQRRPNSVIVNTLTARRKLQQVKRIPNAVVPGRPFKGIKL